MFLSASSLPLDEYDILAATAIGTLALAYTSYSMGLKDGQKKDLHTSTANATRAGCPFSGHRSASNLNNDQDKPRTTHTTSDDEPHKMVCPFSGRSSSGASFSKKGNEMKTYKFHVSDEHLEIIKATLPLVAETGTTFTQHFYKRLFTSNPELKNVFNQTNQEVGHQPKRLFNLIAVAAMSAIEAGEISGESVEAVCQKHVALGVPAEAYSIVGSHVLGTIEDLLTKDQAVLNAWGTLYGEIANIFVERETEIYASIGWKGRRGFELVKKVAQSETITRFQFRPVDGRPVPTFPAGHYTTVWVKHQGSGIHGEFTEQPRHYTLATDTDDDDGVANRTLSISVKRDGLISNILHNAEIGSEFDLSAPVGCFDLAEAEQLWLSTDDPVPVVFLSAGVGVTPVLAMLEKLPVDRPASWLHVTQNGNNHAYRDRVRHLAATRKGGLNTRVWYSKPTQADGPPGGMESCPSLFNISKYHFEGRMDLIQSLRNNEDSKYKFPEELLHLENPLTRYYMCGPSGFMEAQIGALKELGVDASRIHSEGF